MPEDIAFAVLVVDVHVFKLLLSKGQWVATWRITGPKWGYGPGEFHVRHRASQWLEVLTSTY